MGFKIKGICNLIQFFKSEIPGPDLFYKVCLN
jgi:hypothetical protein